MTMMLEASAAPEAITGRLGDKYWLKMNQIRGALLSFFFT